MTKPDLKLAFDVMTQAPEIIVYDAEPNFGNNTLVFGRVGHLSADGRYYISCFVHYVYEKVW